MERLCVSEVFKLTSVSSKTPEDFFHHESELNSAICKR